MNEYERYRKGLLGMVSEEQILTLAGEGDLQNCFYILRDRGEAALRVKVSNALSKIEHQHNGGINAPEWTVNSHNILVEILTRTVMYMSRMRPT